MHIAKALFEPRHGFATCGKTEMAGFDDPGVDGADRNLMQALAFHRQKCVSRPCGRCRAPGAEGIPHIPGAQIEPGPRIRGAHRFEPVQTVNRALEADGGRMDGADRRKAAARTVDGCDGNLTAVIAHRGHLHRRRVVAPQPEQNRVACGQFVGNALPDVGRHHGARPRTMCFDWFTVAGGVRRSAALATRAVRRRVETKRRAPEACRRQRRARERDGRTSGCRRHVPCRPALVARRKQYC